ncbi:MAG: DNA methyltransferase [Proteobacteria bacterium]|nr:DNA methyltransferase [Pseudomonadota bacterium]
MRRHSPGIIRDAIVGYLSHAPAASASEIHNAVAGQLGHVSASSVRSYLSLNCPGQFQRLERGRYSLAEPIHGPIQPVVFPEHVIGKGKLINADSFAWLKQVEPSSIHAVVTDPPYGLVEYTDAEKSKLRAGKGGVWRVPPSFDGHRRAPLPRFTVLNEGDKEALEDFFHELGCLLLRATVPGANVIVAANPLLAHTVATAMSASGLELRGQITRLVMTMRGGDRPKNAHAEFPDVSVMPRSMFEPWVVLRHPLEGRVQDNLRKWKTGGFLRPSEDRPFGDVIRSSPTSSAERQLAAHPSLKPQAFMRQIVRAVLPMKEGVVLDPFAGSGSTIAAANAVGYHSIGIEKDLEFYKLAKNAIPKLEKLSLREIDPVLA